MRKLLFFLMGRIAVQIMKFVKVLVVLKPMMNMMSHFTWEYKMMIFKGPQHVLVPPILIGRDTPFMFTLLVCCLQLSGTH
jgi:hypothetical protein